MRLRCIFRSEWPRHRSQGCDRRTDAKGLALAAQINATSQSCAVLDQTLAARARLLADDVNEGQAVRSFGSRLPHGSPLPLCTACCAAEATTSRWKTYSAAAARRVL